jgi:hypothetical protein
MSIVLTIRGFTMDGVSIGTKSVVGANDTTKGRAMIDTGVSDPPNPDNEC